MKLQIDVDELLKIIGGQRVEIEILNRRLAAYEQAMQALQEKKPATVVNKPKIVPSINDGGKT